MCNIKTYSCFGLRISSFKKNELLNYLTQTIKRNKKTSVFGYSFSLISMLKEYPEIYIYGNRFDIMLTDGRWFHLFCKLFNKNIQSDISIPLLVFELLKLAEKENFSIFLYGATKENNIKAIDEIKTKYPNINYIFGMDGYNYTEIEVISKINEINPNILLVGLPSPQKEIFCKKNEDAINANIVIPCGGVIDVLSGKVKYSPKIVKKMGLAFIFRFFQDPQRFFKRYLLGSFEIIFKLLPYCFYKKITTKNQESTIPDFYKINNIS
jgi:N-acetylglucosaminyldiphosphoundecaprenol N-acetyl-beta-D-mannosaminyltransferase